MNILFWIYKSRTNKAGKAPIMMRITIDGERAELKTNITIEPELWNKELQCIIGSSPLVKQYNDTIVGLTTQAWSFF